MLIFISVLVGYQIPISADETNNIQTSLDFTNSNTANAVDYQIFPDENSITVAFSEKGAYSIGSVLDFTDTTIESMAFTDSLTINNLESATKYSFKLYKGRDLKNCLGVISVITKPEPITEINSKRNKDNIILTWNYQSDLLFYDVYRSENGNEFNKIATVTEFFNNQYQYIDTNIKNNSRYSYYLIGYVNTNDNLYAKSVEVSENAKYYYSLPSVSGSCKTYAYYTAVTAKSSPQYKLLNSSACYTDKTTGIRMVDGCYCVALGSYYGTKIGTKYHIVLSSGNEFDAILCDQKADRHTNSTHQYAVNNKDIIEFYVQRGYIPSRVKGDYGVLPQFKGSVVSIEKIIK